MNAAEALRSIRYDWLSYTQEKVHVDFDNAHQVPLLFSHRGEERTVCAVLGRFRVRTDDAFNGFLIKVDDGEVYFLYFHEPESRRPLVEGCWVLSFRVLSDSELMSFCREERKMLVSMTVKKVVDFHGHLCPEIAIGMKACEYASRLLVESEDPVERLSVIAENCTSALDAFQILLGVTVGNQALRVLDFGKHNYTFSRKSSDQGFRLRFRNLEFGDEQTFETLEEKIVHNLITLDEVVQFQQLLDARVDKLLSSLPEELFDLERNCPPAMTIEAPTTYVSCSGCGQQVLRERAVKDQGRFYCTPCHTLLNADGGRRKLH